MDTIFFPTQIVPRLKIFAEHIILATIACLTAMVQGKYLDLTLGHWQVALTTGTGAGILAIIFSIGLLKRYKETKYFTALSVFVATFCADIWVHPTNFGSPFTEALYTAAGAAVISILVSIVKGKK
jgi:hypothetical protein